MPIAKLAVTHCKEREQGIAQLLSKYIPDYNDQITCILLLTLQQSVFAPGMLAFLSDLTPGSQFINSVSTYVKDLVQQSNFHVLDSSSSSSPSFNKLGTSKRTAKKSSLNTDFKVRRLYTELSAIPVYMARHICCELMFLVRTEYTRMQRLPHNYAYQFDLRNDFGTFIKSFDNETMEANLARPFFVLALLTSAILDVPNVLDAVPILGSAKTEPTVSTRFSLITSAPSLTFT